MSLTARLAQYRNRAMEDPELQQLRADLVVWAAEARGGLAGLGYGDHTEEQTRVQDGHDAPGHFSPRAQRIEDGMRVMRAWHRGEHRFRVLRERYMAPDWRTVKTMAERFKVSERTFRGWVQEAEKMLLRAIKSWQKNARR